METKTIQQQLALREYFRILSKIIDLHCPQEITLPNGEWGMGCKHCDGLEYPCKTIEIIRSFGE